MLNSISGNAKQKAEALGIDLSGFRDADDGEFVEEGDCACLWASSPNGDDFAQYVYLGRVYDFARDFFNDRGRGLSVRSFLDKKRV